MKYDVIIIGGGVAGLTAGLYAGRTNKSVLIIESDNIGGIVATIDKIENYPGFDSISGMELSQKLYMQVVNLNVNFEYSKVTFIDFDNKSVKTNLNQFEYSSLIIASGSSYKKLNAVNEDKFKLKGISYCAICDGSLYKNKNIVIFTDSNSAKDSYDYLKNITNSIKVFNLSSSCTFVNDSINNVSNIEFMGNDSVEGFNYTINNDIFEIRCDGVFIALGREISNKIFNNKIELDGQYIKSNELMHTNIPGVFVAGDIRTKSLRQIITACADGAIAATEAIKYLSTK